MPALAHRAGRKFIINYNFCQKTHKELAPGIRIHMSQVFIRHISGITQPSKCLITKDIISVNFVYFDISLLFVDAEIFVAYAGSCLLLD